MADFLLPIVVFSVPVLAVVVLALTGRRLSGSCGGMQPDGRCGRCGKTAETMPPPGERGACP